MRSFLLFMLLCLCLVANAQSPTAGSWLAVRQEMGGKVLPPAAYAGQKLILKDSTYTVVAESVDKGIVKVRDNKMDIYGTNGVNKGKHFTAIFQINDGQLIVCYNLAGTDYPAAFDTAGHPMYFLSVFKKE